jgi:hypothetical protein
MSDEELGQIAESGDELSAAAQEARTEQRVLLLDGVRWCSHPGAQKGVDLSSVRQ